MPVTKLSEVDSGREPRIMITDGKSEIKLAG